jgi:hypothetical protein
LPLGDVRAAAGMSANIVPGALADNLTNARVAAGKGASPVGNGDYARGALVAAAVGPGLAPFAGARVGLGNKVETGLAYTGRGVRLDGRRSFGDGPWTFSAGAGGTAVLYGRQQGSDLPTLNLEALHGYGLDVPLLAGWESAARIYQVWFGARGGWEHVTVEQLSSEPSQLSALNGDSQPINLHGDRFYGGVVGGLAVGFNHVHVALEADVAYQYVSGDFARTNVHINGLTIAPATALWFSF